MDRPNVFSQIQASRFDQIHLIQCLNFGLASVCGRGKICICKHRLGSSFQFRFLTYGELLFTRPTWLLVVLE